MKRKAIKTALIFLMLPIVTTLAHAFAMPQTTRCYLIDWYDFEKDGNLYFRTSADPEEIAFLASMLEQAEERTADFWGEHIAHPTFIYCHTDEDYKQFGSPLMTPAMSHLSFESFVVISKQGADLDILAHEISHTELAERVGHINRTLKIPTWFDEGLAMQVDHRNYYSQDTLTAKSDNFKHLPDIENMYADQFWGGSREDIMLNYMAAKYKVSLWHSKKRLKGFVEQINEGKTFEEAYLNE